MLSLFILLQEQKRKHGLPQILGLQIVAIQIGLTFLLFKPVLAAAAALGKALSRAMHRGNTKTIWLEAGFVGA